MKPHNFNAPGLPLAYQRKIAKTLAGWAKPREDSHGNPRT